MIRRSALSLTSAVACVAACSSSGGDTSAAAPTSCPGTELIATASDYVSSVVCGAPPCELGPQTSGVDLGKDPVLASSNGRMFYIARDKDEIYELNTSCGTAFGPGGNGYNVTQSDVTTGPADPQDVAAAKDGSLFIPLYDVPRIVVFGTDGKQELSLDISMYDADLNPQASSIAIAQVGGVEKAFVTLERLDNTQAAYNDGTFLQSKQASMMLRIDVATRTIEAAIPLAGRNPFGMMSELDGAYYLAEPGNFDAIDEPFSGIERFDSATSTTKLLVTETALGASVSEVAVTDGCGAAIVAGPQATNPTSLVTFDPTTGAALTTAAAPLLATDGYDLEGLTWSGDTLYVGDRRTSGALYNVHVYTRDPGTCILHDSGRSVTLPQKPVAFRPAAGP